MPPPEDITVQREVTNISSRQSIPLKAISSAITHQGNRRTHNEDAILAIDEQKLWVVADGMGGHNAGDVASQSIVNDLKEYKNHGNLGQSVLWIDKIIHKTNINLIQKAEELTNDGLIGSTVAILVAQNSDGILMWAGDSRVYRLRQGNLEQLSKDHSLVNEAISSGEILIEDAKDHPDANVITRAVGHIKSLQIEQKRITIEDADRYFICSDGVNKELDDSAIAELISDLDIADANQKLVQRTLDLGGRDNISSILIEFSAL
ncbi:MAG: serine/threonine-protein phosphatase [Gammaproteobacteria bacterium]|nr:serine/threonine-protein phosphatase [Gammaproteobacteria bacterium]